MNRKGYWYHHLDHQRRGDLLRYVTSLVERGIWTLQDSDNYFYNRIIPEETRTDYRKENSE